MDSASRATVSSSPLDGNPSECRKAEPAVRQTQDRLAVAQAAGGLAVFEWDVASGAFTWTPGLSNLYEPAELPADYARWAKRVKDLPEVERVFEQCFRLKRDSLQVDFRISGPGGSARWLECYARVIYGQEGKPVRLVGIHKNITHRKRTEEALRRSKDQLKLITDAVPALVAYIDTEYRYVFANKTYQQWLGLKPEKMRGRQVREVLGEAMWESLRPSMERAMAGEAVVYERELALAGTPPRWHQVAYTPDRNDNGEVRGLVVLVSETNEHLEKEIYRRKKAQDALRRAKDRLQALSHQLLEVQENDRRELARELHDQIGQALTALKINLQTAERFTEPGARGKSFGESIGLLDQILDQVRNLSLTLRPALLDEAGLGPALKVHLAQVARRSGLQAELQMSPMLTRVAPAVETACFRIAQEALTNVLRHAQASTLAVRLSQTEKMLSLSIRDNGVGCDKELALQRAQRGESLGWAGMRERAALVGGHIEFISAPGEGTEIQASFPLRIRPADKTKPPEV